MPNSPRRRASPPKKRAKKSGGASMLGLALGVIVAGLGIGALVSAFFHRGDGGAVAVATSPPHAQRTYTPLPVVVPTTRPTAEPTPTRAPKSTHEASPTPQASATPSAAATATASATTAAAAASTATAIASGKPTSPASATSAPKVVPTSVAATALAHASAPASAPPSTTMRVVTAESPRVAVSARVVPPSPPPVRVAVAKTPVPAAEETDLGLAEPAAVTVRRYLAAVLRGDGAGASAYLDAGANRVSEIGVLDQSAKVSGVHARTTSATTAHVEVDITSAKGAYFATYDVAQTAAGPRITQHELIKP